MMPLPGRSDRWLSTQAKRAFESGSLSTPSRRDARANGPRMVTTPNPVGPDDPVGPDAPGESDPPGRSDPPGALPAPPSCSATSATTRLLAVAVVASTGIPGGSCAMSSRSRR